MKSKAVIIFISIIVFLLILILALLINHLVVVNDSANPTLKKIDDTAMEVYENFIQSTKNAFEYIKKLHNKITAIETPEYPHNHLPLYPESKVTEYSFDAFNNTLHIRSESNQNFDSIYSYYNALFSNDENIDYFKQYKSEYSYTAYGMIGNFVFLMDVNPIENRKNMYSISTELQYLVDEKLAEENFFRQQNGISSYVFTSPYIYLYQKVGDEGYIYIQLRDDKSRILNIDTHVKLYIDDELYSSRDYGDTVRLPISALSTIQNIKMISRDNTGRIRAFDILENALCYDASDQKDFYHLASNFSTAENLYIYNTENVGDVLYFEYFPQLKSLYLTGSDLIADYSPIFNLSEINKLYLNNVNSEIIHELNQLGQLKVLEISNCTTQMILGEDFKNLSCKELYFDNCSNLTFGGKGTFAHNLELLSIEDSYAVNYVSFNNAYPNLHIINLNDCNSITTLLNLNNLGSLNMLNVSNCRSFDLSEPIESINMMNISFKNCNSFSESASEYIHSILSNKNLINLSVSNCGNSSDINHSNKPWKESK